MITPIEIWNEMINNGVPINKVICLARKHLDTLNTIKHYCEEYSELVTEWNSESIAEVEQFIKTTRENVISKALGCEWIVYSTAVSNVALLLSCPELGINGFVLDPTKKEWEEAFYAPTKSYKWAGGNDRIQINI